MKNETKAAVLTLLGVLGIIAFGFTLAVAPYVVAFLLGGVLIVFLIAIIYGVILDHLNGVNSMNYGYYEDDDRLTR